MITKENLDYLKELDHFRTDARTLRDKALGAIVAFNLDDEDRWEQEISDNEKVLFRRAKHLAWNLGKIQEHDCEHLKDLFYPSAFATSDENDDGYSPDVNYPEWPVIDLPLFKIGQFVDPAGLCRRVKEGTDPVSNYILREYKRQQQKTSVPEQFESEFKPLDEYVPGQEPSSILLSFMVKLLNSALTMPSLYKQVDTVTLSAETKSLINENPQAGGLVRLNRRLLDETYSKEMVSSPWFTVDQFVDATSLCRRLKEATESSDPVLYYIRSQFERFRGSEVSPLATYAPGQLPSKKLLNYVARMLNNALSKRTLAEIAAKGAPLTPESRDVIDNALDGERLARSNRILLNEAYPAELASSANSLELFHMSDEPAPILFAANFLRTRLGNLRGYLDESTISCYYRVIRELYNLHNTNWALGAARPGEHSGKPSVFVTTECSRAIGYFARLMENTSEFLHNMDEIKDYVRHVKAAQQSEDPAIPALPAAWCTSELECCFASAKTTIEGSRDYVAVLLPNLKDGHDLDQIIKLVEESVARFAERSFKSFQDVEQWAKIIRTLEENSRTRSLFADSRQDRSARSGKKGRVKLQQMPELDLTETAHKIARGALAGARLEFKKLTKTDKNILEEASQVFATLAKWLRTHLDPAREYFEKVLHKCLAENAREPSPKLVQDLAFSALSVGLITKEWGRHDCRQAVEILCENLDEGGQFPEGLPFAYTHKGEGRVVINAQIIRAFAQLTQHLTAHPNIDVLKKMPVIVDRLITYFRSSSR